MEHNLAAKLRLTAAALGCSSRKELCQRFYAVNPATICGLDRLHKWLQGRALPRSAHFYDDWAKVVGSRRPGAWFASSSAEALLAELSVLFDADPEMLLNAEVLGLPSLVRLPAGRPKGENGLLAGTFACYSHAWSPHFRGQLIRGSLVLRPGRGTTLAVAAYTEFIAGREFLFQGNAVGGGGVVMIPLLDEVGHGRLCLTLFEPRPPASVLCGMLSGATVLDHEPRPSVGRLVAMRLPTDDDPGAAGGYLAPSSHAFTDDLRACGLSIAPESGIDAGIMAFLNSHTADGAVSQITAEQFTDLVRMCDRVHLAGRQHARPPPLDARDLARATQRRTPYR